MAAEAVRPAAPAAGVETRARRARHPYKYRLFYGRAGRREVGYDNERLKGDHRHYGSVVEPYQFESPEKLVDDFLCDVAQRRTQ